MIVAFLDRGYYMTSWRSIQNFISPGDHVIYSIIYYIDTDEIPGFFLLLKNHIFIARSEDTIFSFICDDIGIAMVTNMIFGTENNVISIIASLFLLYNFISEFHNILVTGIFQ